MSKVPTISILTPVWNGLPYIRETVESVLSQDFQDWEMVVSDNASTDGTWEYLTSLTDPRIKVYRHPENRGVYRNIHNCFTKATAPIFMGLCADDYFLPGGLKKVVDAWEDASYKPGLMTFNWKARQVKHDPLMKFSYEQLPHATKGTDAALAYFLFGCLPGNFSEVSGRLPVVVPEHYLYDVKFSADFEYWMRISKMSGVEFNDADVVYVRRHDKVAATYMVTKGEYHEESIPIYENIINDLSPYFDRKKLVAYYNVAVCSFHLQLALKSALKGKFTALKSFLKLQSPAFWPQGFQTLGCLPFALSKGLRFRVSIAMAKNFLTANKKVTVNSDRSATIESQSSIHA